MMMSISSCNFLFLIIVYKISLSSQHGRLMEPPARNTLWRMGFQAPPNYEDSQLFCGGIKAQWHDNEGKCGVCGDSYGGLRVHETGGYMARNITARVYTPETTIDAVVDLVANHAGSFVFQMCWRNSFAEKETEACFEDLKVYDWQDRYVLKTLRTGLYVIPVRLPRARTCTHCILRWHWMSANNWGTCPNGTEAVGCGPQETYRNCADIAVKFGNGIRGPLINEIEELI